MDTFRLNNGVEIPAIGLGVFQTPADETRAAVEAALATGYRHIDTAAAYGNEREVGEAVHASGVPNSEVFIETKIWISDYGFEETLHGFEKSAAKLGLDRIDLLILHQALPSDFDRTVQAYKALEKMMDDGRVRAIGVSNFMVDHLTSLLEQTTVTPAVNQIELHPYFQQCAVQAFGALDTGVGGGPEPDAITLTGPPGSSIITGVLDAERQDIEAWKDLSLSTDH